FCRPSRSRQHRVVHRDGDAATAETQGIEQRGHRGVRVDVDPLLVDQDDHWCAPTGASSETICSAVQGASRKPDRPWPAATSVRASKRCTNGRLSGVIGRSPATHSASSYSPSAGSTAHASSRRSRTPETTGAVSRPCSYWVAPTTTPSARGTRYTCRPCTRARITRCGKGIQ